MKILLMVFILIGSIGCQQVTDMHQVEQESDSWMLDHFIKVDSLNPILHPIPDLLFRCPISNLKVRWEERNVLNPTAVVKNDQVYLFYRAQDLSGTSRIGLAISSDGLHFRKNPTPVFYPDQDTMKKFEWHYEKSSQNTDLQDGVTRFDGVEDPRIVEREDGTYVMTYTSYDGRIARLCIASSKDLLHWTKHGLVLEGVKYEDLWSKSGAIVAQLVGNKILAAKIHDKYWMYFGDTDLFMATSDDLIHWEVLENAENQKMISVLHPRPGYFDSRLVEPGPYALIRDQGILLIYNASNAANLNDQALPIFSYAAGQALFDKEMPYKLIHRTDQYFIHPDKPYEKIGEVNEVCFVEGLVYFKGKWFLYYGTADSKIAVAVREGLD